MTAEDAISLAKEKLSYKKVVVGLLIALVGLVSTVITVNEKVRETAKDLSGWGALSALVTRVELIEEREAERVKALADLTQRMLEIKHGLEELQQEANASSNPCVEFPQDTQVHDVEIEADGQMFFRWGFYKMRECGRPTPQLRLYDGSNRDHNIKTSVTDGQGQGRIYPVDANRLQYIDYGGRVIPFIRVDRGIGHVQVCVVYRDRPRVEERCSPRMPVQITKEAAAAMSPKIPPHP